MSIMPGEIYGLFVKHENVFCGDLSQWKDDDDFFESTDFVLDMEGIEIDTDDYKGVYITSVLPQLSQIQRLKIFHQMKVMTLMVHLFFLWKNLQL